MRTKKSAVGAGVAGAVVWLAGAGAWAAPSADGRAGADQARPDGGVMTLLVDGTDAPRRIFHSTMTIPAKPGALTLVYPKWIPGEHGPTGPIADVAGLKVMAAGKAVSWRRDLADLWAVNCQVPEGATSVEVKLDYLSPQSAEGFTASPSSTDQLAIIDWHLMLVYPKGQAPEQYTCAATLRLPAGWKFGSALEVSQKGADGVQFAPVPLTVLIDSPVVAGAHYRGVNLTPGGNPEHHMDIVADSEAALDLDQATIGHYRQLIAEAAALFRSRHYQRYHFLVTLSDHVQSFGLEHHQCSDDRLPEAGLTDDERLLKDGSLMTHEYVHSWNGKYRRPADLTTRDYQEPMQADLLWVYEGLTEYYGDVLAARCENWLPEDYREYLARVGAGLEHTSGRTWRPLQDTCDGAPFLYAAGGSWSNWRRGVDFYDEGELIWLEADVLIRQRTSGARSLDDFCRKFHGGASPTLGGEVPSVATYTFEDVVGALNEIAPYDWKGFFRERLDSTGPHAPVGGITGGGWKLVYTDEPNEFIKGEGIDLTYSLGIRMKDDGEVGVVVMGMPGEKAGLGPGMKVRAVNGRKLTPERMEEAVRASRSVQGPIELIVENADFYKTIRIEYHGGLRYPHLERDDAMPDLIGEIIAPLTEEP